MTHLGSHTSAGTSCLTAAAQRSLDFGFRAISQHKWVRGGRDPPRSGSGCGPTPIWEWLWPVCPEAEDLGFKEGSFIPGKIFLDDGQVKKITASRMKLFVLFLGRLINSVLGFSPSHAAGYLCLIPTMRRWPPRCLLKLFQKIAQSLRQS